MLQVLGRCYMLSYCNETRDTSYGGPRHVIAVLQHQTLYYDSVPSSPIPSARVVRRNAQACTRPLLPAL